MGWKSFSFSFCNRLPPSLPPVAAARFVHIRLNENVENLYVFHIHVSIDAVADAWLNRRHNCSSLHVSVFPFSQNIIR